MDKRTEFRFEGMTFEERLWLSGLASVLVASSALLFWHSVHYPSCCDAITYGADAAIFQDRGFVRDLPSAGVRTYGYTLFLAIVFAGYDWEPMWGLFSPRAAIVQTILYLIACLSLFFAVLPRDRVFAWCIAVGLMCNPFILNYLPLRLTEGITASIAVFLITCAVALDGPSSTRRLATVVLVGSLLAGLAIMIRAANLSLFMAWATTVALVAWQHKDRRLLIVVLAVAGMFVPLLPQLATNYLFYDKISIFPGADVGGYQARLGLENFKFGVQMFLDRQQKGILYPSSLFSRDEIEQYGVWLYLNSPVRGAALAAAHIFQSVNHDFFFSYTYGRNPWANAPMNFLAHVSLFLAGIAACDFAAKAIGKLRRPHPAIVFAAITVALTLMINSVAVVETRFGMLIFLAAGPLAIWSVVTFRSSPYAVPIGAAALLYGTCAVALSFAMLPAPLIP